MKLTFEPWFLTRILLIGLMIWAGFSYSSMPDNWTAAILVPTLSAILMFVWLLGSASSPNIDWSDPRSLSKPFFPMKRYPIRFLFLGSGICIFNGIASAIHDLFTHGHLSALSCTAFLWGVFMLIALSLFWLSPSNAHNRNQRRD
jgi:hypothetical protein